MLVDGTTGGRPGLCTSTDGGDSRPLVASWWLWSALPVLSCARALRPQMMAGSNAGSPCCSRPHRGHSRSSALHRMAENRVYRRMAAASSRRWRSPRQMTCTRAHTHAKQHVLRQETLAAAHAGNAGLPARTPTRLHETEGRRATQRAPGTSAARPRPPRTFCSTPPGTRRRTSGHSLSQKTSSAEGAPPSRWDRTGFRRVSSTTPAAAAAAAPAPAAAPAVVGPPAAPPTAPAPVPAPAAATDAAPAPAPTVAAAITPEPPKSVEAAAATPDFASLCIAKLRVLWGDFS